VFLSGRKDYGHELQIRASGGFKTPTRLPPFLIPLGMKLGNISKPCFGWIINPELKSANCKLALAAGYFCHDFLVYSFKEM
jgi:hypothetical protein